MNLRFLHLEDNPNDAELVRESVLEDWPDCEITHVSTRKEYLNALELGAFDMILADNRLPCFDGLSALKLTRDQSPDVPFIFISGTMSEELVVEALKAGATDYVLKNRLERLGAAIGRALREVEHRAKRVQAEEKLHQKEAQFRQIVENVADLIAIVDLDGNRLYNSPSYHAILGDVEACCGTDSFEEIHPEDRPRMRRIFNEMIQSGEGQRSEFRFLLKDGTVRYIESQASVIRNAQGEVVSAVIVSRDETERREVEERTRVIQAKLETTNASLVRRNTEIQNFYHTLSHELKTPLTAAREFVSIVTDGLAGPVNETQLEYLGIAYESCNQLRVCINDLLDVTRLETGKLNVEKQPDSVTALVQRVVTMMSPVAAEKGIQLSHQLAPDLPEIPIDASRILQVITNLLNNALKFTPSGERIVVQVQRSPSREDFLRVSVKDTGRGIPREQLDRIFDRLYQIRTGDAASGQGIGLGLHICQELVHLHGGHITVESEEGAGSDFSFDLPMSPAADLTLLPEPERPCSSEPAPGTNARAA